MGTQKHTSHIRNQKTRKNKPYMLFQNRPRGSKNQHGLIGKTPKKTGGLRIDFYQSISKHISVNFQCWLHFLNQIFSFDFAFLAKLPFFRFRPTGSPTMYADAVSSLRCKWEHTKAYATFRWARGAPLPFVPAVKRWSGLGKKIQRGNATWSFSECFEG